MVELTGRLTPKENLYGFLSSGFGLDGILSDGLSMTGSLTLPTRPSEEIYDGSYEVRSLALEDQVLSTKKKFLNDDIIVRQIEYSETTNPSGGYTIFIG
jgi:hypothetical protein